MIMPSRPPRICLQMRVDLLGTDIPIWRRIRVPGELSLVGLHYVIQEAMGWSQIHLFRFSTPAGEMYQDYLLTDPEDLLGGVLDAGSTPVAGAFGPDAPRIFYEYDFGDVWDHLVQVEDSRVQNWRSEHEPECLDGEGRCPPEDCGGIESYHGMLEALADPCHEEHSSWMDWLGGSFDPAEFDVGAANARLRELVECGWNPSELLRRRWGIPARNPHRVEANRDRALAALSEGARRWIELRRESEVEPFREDGSGPGDAARRLIRITCDQRPNEVERLIKPAGLAAGAFHAAIKLIRDPDFGFHGSLEAPPLTAQEAATCFGVSAGTVSNWSRTAVYSLFEHSEEEAFALRAFVGGHPDAEPDAPPVRGGTA